MSPDPKTLENDSFFFKINPVNAEQTNDPYTTGIKEWKPKNISVTSIINKGNPNWNTGRLNQVTAKILTAITGVILGGWGRNRSKLTTTIIKPK